MAYNIIVTGTKSFNDYKLLKEKCDEYLGSLVDGGDSDGGQVRIITGDDGSAERLAQRYAGESGLELVVHPLEYERYGSLAATIRNTDMVADADGAVCFWNGSSAGVGLTIDLCGRKGISCEVIKYDK